MTFAAGIIPYTFFNGKRSFLLGLEKSNKKWSGFVGTSESGESPQETALREFHEETTMTFLQLNQYLIESLNRILPVIETTKTGKYAYLWFIQFPPEIDISRFHVNQTMTNQRMLKEKSDIGWWNIEQIRSGNVLFILKKTILKLINTGVFPCS